MTANDFRSLALEMPSSSESSHMNHPDFRVGGKIFATLGPGEELGMVKLTPEQQRLFVRTEPRMFSPVPGGWGRRGATRVHLDAAMEEAVRPALEEAWRNVAPKRLVEEREIDE
ncbi:MAG: MmcQ/YjbR family DNA-binding protein [Candidatus Acidiferrum sp.]